MEKLNQTGFVVVVWYWIDGYTYTEMYKTEQTTITTTLVCEIYNYLVEKTKADVRLFEIKFIL